MLTPDYIQRLTEGAEEIAAQLHQDIITRIVERIMTRIGRGDSYILTATDKWQLEVLRDAGFLLEDLQREISKKTGVQLREMKAAFEDAGVRTLAYDHAIYEAAGLSPAPLLQSPNLVRLLQRGYEATAREWENFTRTTANAAQQLYIRECDRAYHLVSSGLLSYQQAAREAVERIAKDGVTVTYPSGHTDTIETATLRALRTGVSQACGDITEARMDEMHWDIVLTSAHLGARVTKKNDYTNHYWWQGRFFSRSGKDPRFPPFSLCGMGDVQGIYGANCRHSHGPGDGKHNPFEKFDSEENKKAYELSQRQRALERRIRKTKREVQALQTALDNAPESCKPELQAAYQKKAALLTKQNKAYNDFCEENDLKRLSDRLSIAKWDRKQAAKARGAAARGKKPTAPEAYEDVTEEWYAAATPNSHQVANMRDWTVDGVTYHVDGNHVVLDHSPHEKAVAELLEQEFGGEFFMVPRINSPSGIRTPDYFFRARSFDLASPEGKGKNTIFDAAAKKKGQAENLIIDLSKCPLPDSEVMRQVSLVYRSNHTRFVNEILLLRDEKVVRILRKRKR